MRSELRNSILTFGSCCFLSFFFFLSLGRSWFMFSVLFLAERMNLLNIRKAEIFTLHTRSKVLGKYVKCHENYDKIKSAGNMSFSFSAR